jgi:hypothetical protein
MEQVVREPIELTDEDVKKVAGGLLSITSI